MDIETEHWDFFVMGGLWTEAEGFRYWDWRFENDNVDELLAIEGDVWAHNGGRYDTLWLLDHCMKRGLRVELCVSGQRIITLSVGKLKVRDSAALVPMSLEMASQLGSVRKTRTELPCRCDKECGGYCSIRRGMPLADYRKLVSYLEQDCLATASFMGTLIDYAAQKDLDLCSTIGASAYATARRRYGIPDADWSKTDLSEGALYKYVREGYFGGRVQVFQPQAGSGYRYDINSAYPAALSTLEVPFGHYRYESGTAAQLAYASGRPGVFRANVHVPECFLPPLPIRTGERIAYPCGPLTGTWSAHEMARAEKLGARVERVLSGVTWTASEMVFAPFCRYVWELRDQAGPKTAWGTLLKWFANSLTGKLAQRPERETIALNPAADATFCPADYPCQGIHPRQQCCVHRCTRICGAYRELRRGIFTRNFFRVSRCAHVQVAAYLTAFTRGVLLEQLLADGAGGESAVYCDTDSVIATKERTHDVGEALGQFKLEGRFRDFTALAPKTYRYWDPDTEECVAKAKGIPDAGRNFDHLRQGVALDRGVYTFRSAARGGGSLFARKQTVRVVSPDGVHFGDRILRQDGKTYPMALA